MSKIMSAAKVEYTMLLTSGKEFRGMMYTVPAQRIHEVLSKNENMIPEKCLYFEDVTGLWTVRLSAIIAFSTKPLPVDPAE